jgi:hypothetical protein
MGSIFAPRMFPFILGWCGHARAAPLPFSVSA